MAKNSGTDFFSTLRASGLRKSVAKTLAELEGGGRSAGTRAEALARQVIADLRSAADAIEKRLDIGGAGTRGRTAKKAAPTRKTTATKRTAAAKRGAAKRAAPTPRKTTARKTTARKTTTRRTSTRKTSGS
jgi:DNA-binding protein HU-beta